MPSESNQQRRPFISLTSVLLIVVILALGYLVYQNFTDKSEDHDETSSTVTEFNLEDIGELSTQAGHFTNVQVISKAKKKIWFVKLPGTATKVIFSYDGDVKAGYDFREIKYRSNHDDHTVTVELPEAKIMDVTVDQDSLQVYHEDQGLFNRVSIEDYGGSLKELEASVKQSAIDNGLLEEARNNAMTLIKAFLAPVYPLGQYTYTFN